MILIYIAVFGVFTAVRQYNFQTQTWDMGIFIQTFWNTIHGQIMQNTLEELPNHLAIHMSPFLFLLVPFYALLPSPYTLLIIQTLAMALGAWPLYLLAKKILGNGKLALGLAAGYLLYPSLHWLNVFDFHEIAFLPPLLLAAFYFINEKRWGWAGIFFALSAATKEDAIIAVAFAGLYLLVKKSDSRYWWSAEKKFGLIALLLAIGYFLLATKVIMPALGGGLLRLDRYAQFGGTVPEIFQNIIRQPSILADTLFNAYKLKYVFWLFFPVAFLPLFSRSALILLIPGLTENLLTNFKSQFAGFYQYDAVLIAGIFIASIFGFKNLLEKWPAKSKIIHKTLIAAPIAGYLILSPLNPIFFPIDLFRSNPQWEAYRQMIKMVPPQASVAAHTNLIPHLANRERIYMLGKESFPTDYILIDGADPFGFTDAKTFEDYANNYIDSGQYEVTALEERYFVLKKKDSQIIFPSL